MHSAGDVRTYTGFRKIHSVRRNMVTGLKNWISVSVICANLRTNRCELFLFPSSYPYIYTYGTLAGAESRKVIFRSRGVPHPAPFPSTTLGIVIWVDKTIVPPVYVWKRRTSWMKKKRLGHQRENKIARRMLTLHREGYPYKFLVAARCRFNRRLWKINIEITASKLCSASLDFINEKDYVRLLDASSI